MIKIGADSTVTQKSDKALFASLHCTGPSVLRPPPRCNDPILSPEKIGGPAFGGVAITKPELSDSVGKNVTS
jgi:hypothetical protein